MTVEVRDRSGNVVATATEAQLPELLAALERKGGQPTGEVFAVFAIDGEGMPTQLAV
jgi:hypothetical protein